MRKAETPEHRFVVGRWADLRGDVTTLSSIVDQSPGDLEVRLGYEKGRLRLGYSVLVLVEHVGPEEFIWGDQTHYSGRWQFLRDAGVYAQRVDILRAALMKKHGNEAAADAELYSILGRSTRSLNVLDGPDRIAKVHPNVPHDASRTDSGQYPDSPVRGIPQWTLKWPKRFICIANVMPGATFGEWA